MQHLEMLRCIVDSYIYSMLITPFIGDQSFFFLESIFVSVK